MKKTARGFTLVELLVVIAIIAVLAAVVVIIINPLELTRRSRDARRLIDLANIKQAIDVAVQEATDSGVAVLCNGGSYPCNGSSHNGTRLVDGSGWVKINIGGVKGVTMPTLAADPINDSTFHYTYCADKDVWEINTKLESDQQKSQMENDGGNDTSVYEMGSSLSIIAPSGGSCTY